MELQAHLLPRAWIVERILIFRRPLPGLELGSHGHYGIAGDGSSSTLPQLFLLGSHHLLTLFSFSIYTHTSTPSRCRSSAELPANKSKPFDWFVSTHGATRRGDSALCPQTFTQEVGNSDEPPAAAQGPQGPVLASRWTYRFAAFKKSEIGSARRWS